MTTVADVCKALRIAAQDQEGAYDPMLDKAADLLEAQEMVVAAAEKLCPPLDSFDRFSVEIVALPARDMDILIGTLKSLHALSEKIG